MLFADKRNLEVSLQVALLKIRDKELQFYTDNLMAIGTQAALMSGFAYNTIIMVAFHPEANHYMKSAYLCCMTASMSLELMTVGGSMLAAIYGPGLALRGPDGSMHRSVDGMVLEYKLAFILFSTGIGFFVLGAFIFALLQFDWYLGLPMAAGMVYFTYDLWKYFTFIYHRFSLEESISGKFECGEPTAAAAYAAVHSARDDARAGVGAAAAASARGGAGGVISAPPTVRRMR